MEQFRRKLFNREPGEVDAVKAHMKRMAQELGERERKLREELLCTCESAEKIAEKSSATDEEAELEDWDWE